MNFTPIGVFKSDYSKKYEVPRQPRLVKNSGYIQLNTDLNLPQALKDLEQFSHIWIIYAFHLNNNWKPIVTTPNENESNKGVFATRSPYRPNPIGLTSVKVERISKGKIYVSNHDLLNDTPILDIKPYIKNYDCIEEANNGWLTTTQPFEITYTDEFNKKCDAFDVPTKQKVKNFIEVQLSRDPFHSKQKRISQIDGNLWQMAYGYQRIRFEKMGNHLKIQDIFEVDS